MELNKEYRFKSERARKGFEEKAKQNVKFAKFMENGFVVTNITITESVSAIGIKNGHGGLEILTPVSMGYNGGGPIISSTDDEFQFFEEVTDEIPEPVEDYACLVHTDGSTGYLIRKHHCTKEEAEEFASYWLHGNPKDEVVIVRALTRATLKNTPTIVTVEF